MDAIENATPLELTAVDDIGPITAESVVSWAQNPQTQHQLRMLREAGVNMLSREERRDNRFLGKTFVLTGTLTKYTRDEASAIVESFGGKASSSVSKNLVRPRGGGRREQAGQGAYARHPCYHGG